MPKKAKKSAAPRKSRKAPSKAAVLSLADINDRLACGPFTRVEYIALAEANGYRLNLELDNGRVAMTTRNHIRKLARAGQPITWALG
jgi:hypothetical protein